MMIVAVIGGIAVMIMVGNGVNGFVGLLAGGATAGVGILIAWLSNLVGYAFGQLVENTDTIREILEDMEGDRDDIIDKISNVSTDSQTTKTSSNSFTAPRTNSVTYENTTYVTCPSYQESQPTGKSYCNVCGAKMNTKAPAKTPATPLQVLGNTPKTAGEESKLICCPKCGELQPKGKNYCEVCGGKIPSILN